MKLSQTGTSNSLSIPIQRTFSTNPQEKLSPRQNYHDLMETLGVVKSASGKSLPTNLKDLKDIPKTDRKILPELGPPTGRKDAQMLIKWLDSMLTKVASKNESLEGMLESALSIYETCFHEIVRQVSVHCKERGELINRVWKANISLLERALRISQSSQQTQYQQFRQEKENIKAVAAAEAIRLRSEIEENKLALLNYADKLTNKEEDIVKLGTLNKRLVHRLEIIRGHYESIKKDIVNLKEENRILKAKLLNTETEFVVNDHGVIEAQYKRQKIKRKSKGMLEQIVIEDPIIQAGNNIDINQHENLVHEIVTHENELAELFKKVDFQDEGTDALVIKLEDKEIQTAVEDLCGENCGESKDKVDPTPIIIDLIDLQLQSMSQSGLDNTELSRQKSLKQQILDDIFKHNEEMSRFQHLLEKMKEGSGFTTPIMSTLYSSMNNVLKESKNSEARPEIKRLKTIRKRLWTVIQASRMKKASEIPLVLIHKVKTTPQHKLKRILVKKILLKFIMMIYDSKLQKRVSDPDSKKYEWAQIVFEVLSNKYGPGKIAESKFIQLTSSVIKYKHIKRIKVFGRFLKLFDDFDNDDLDFYLDMIVFLKNSPGKEFSNVEYSDQVLISYEKAMDLFKSNYLQKLTEAERKSVKMWIDSNKFMDSLYKTQVVDQDGLLESIVEKNRSKKYARVNFLKCIYEAADLNDDGYLQQVEFNLLARYMSATTLNEGFTAEIFNEFAETFTDENEVAVQALSFENFSLLSSSYEVFSPESMQVFSKITNNQGAIWHIKQVTPYIDIILNEIRWRLSKKVNWEDYEEEYKMVLEVIKAKVLSQKNPESVWIALRLLQEESKNICIEKDLKTLMPNVQSLVITSTNIL